MRILPDQTIAGYPALEVREFVRRFRFAEFFAEAAQISLALNPRAAALFMNKLVDTGIARESSKSGGRRVFQFTDSGLALANASAAKPIHRRTADRVLGQFLERVRLANEREEFAYRVEAAVLFGSMLTDVDRLGDVDVAIRLEPRLSEETAQEQLCMARRRIADAKGRTFHGVFDWTMWPTQEILLLLKARSSSLSLHDFSDVERMANVQYRVLLGDPQQIAAMIVNPDDSDRADSPTPILGALGTVQERGQRMLAAFSVVNKSDHWIEVLPPQVELRSPNLSAKKKRDQVLAEQVPVSEYRMTGHRLAPGERADGAVEFSRPGFKESADHLVLELGTASAVDHPLLLQLPFVAPGQ